MNDSSVSTINTAMVKSTKPYMMFYFKDDKKSRTINDFKQAEAKADQQNKDIGFKYQVNDKINGKSIDEIFKNCRASFLPEEKEVKIDPTNLKLKFDEIKKTNYDQKIINEEKNNNGLIAFASLECLNETKMKLENFIEQKCVISPFLFKKIIKFSLNCKKINQVRSLAKKFKHVRCIQIPETNQRTKISQKMLAKLNKYSSSELKEVP